METLEVLLGLGLPSGSVGLVVAALLLKKNEPKLSKFAAITGVCLLVVFGVAQAYDAIAGRDIEIVVTPTGVAAIDAAGSVTLDISVQRGDDEVATISIPQLSAQQFDSRLRGFGWRPSQDCATTPQTISPQLWSTNRVHVGQTHTLGRTSYGDLSIRATQFTAAGEAIVTLELAGHGAPIPAQLAIANKNLAVQSFVNVPEFHVAVREADFRASPPWAAFNIFTLR